MDSLTSTDNHPNISKKHINPSPLESRLRDEVIGGAPLTVYKASAGSGKTFTLAVEYIKLLISDPQNYRYTLAVTFTNKATQEMKQRILSKLYGIAYSLPDANDYINKVKEAFPHLEESVIRQRAHDALTMLVHDYNLFRVETIDSFFQRVLRNLARELGLTANLQVMLNDYEVEDEAVDNIIENIEVENDPLLGWIMDFVNERMADDKNWNVIGQIKDFGRNIFSDFYKDHQEELRNIMNNADFFKKYTSSLRALRAKANNDMKAFAVRYKAIASHYGITDSCYSHGHSNAPGYFDNLASGKFLGLGNALQPKMPNSYVSTGMENPEKLVKKADLNKPESIAIINEVAPLLLEAEESRKRAAITVNSVDLTLQNVNQLRLLGRIEEEVRNINSENNDYPLSNTQNLLNDLIDSQDSPFIYEKIGGQLRYIMIDEFQDTSTIQWENFKVLLDDCIAHQRGSLIVGDVKQSIYRWRGGDWKLLQNLNEERFPQILQVKNLDTNYRSQRNIVDFNNAFFTKAAEITSLNAFSEFTGQGAPEQILYETTDITKAYFDVSQKVPDSKPNTGLVEISLLPKANYDGKMILKVRETIERLLSEGIAPKDIAVIVRKNKHIKLLADYFLHNAITVNGKQIMVNMVSDEAFRLDASLAVNVIVKAMTLLTHPDDILTKGFLAKSYQSIRNNTVNDAEIFLNDKGIDNSLPTEFAVNRTELLSMPLVDLAERLYTIFCLDKLNDQSAYICAFFDQLMAYIRKHIAGIDDFLAEWEDNLSGKSIHSDEIDGIRMLTVHKSKGLEFDNVIIPYCDWDIEDSRDILWAQPGVKPYSDLPVVPINIQPRRLQGSIYAHEYQSEHIKNLVDNLNVLYVAFTRASRNLFIFGKKDGAKYPSQLINEVVSDIDLSDSKLNEDDETGELTFRYGSICLPQRDAARTSDNTNIFEQTELGVKVKIENTEPEASFVQSNASTDFMTPDDELEEKKKQQSYINTGNVIHKLFSTIHNYTEVDKAIDQLEFDGVLYERPVTRRELSDYINKQLSQPQIHDWFSPRWKVFNECSILFYDEASGIVREQRPDRVVYDDKEMIVIDFKTGKQLEQHKSQVRGYMRLLNDMGYRNVKGYLWYIRHNEIVKVTA